MQCITPETLQFLQRLKVNNNRVWFGSHKEEYKRALGEADCLLRSIEQEMSKIDQIEKTKLFRIYRDVRFSKDKTPYNPSFRIFLERQKPRLRGGYFLKIEPSNSFLACGFWGPNAFDMNLIRSNIAYDHMKFGQIIGNPKVTKVFGEMKGEKLKTSPRGFSVDHEAIDLLRYKQYLFSHKFSDDEVTSPNFVEHCIRCWQVIRPFFDYMSEILTHNLDGEPLYDAD